MSILRSFSRCLKRFTQPAFSHYYCTNVPDSNADSEDVSVTQNRNGIVWIDMEMSGLDVDKNRILEIACLITDENLNVISDEFQAVLYQPDTELDTMNDWCQNNHGKTGLIDACKKSAETEDAVDINLLYFMMKYIPKGKCPLAGNSVYVDRLFLRKYMPVSNDYIHYRIIDVSSIKEVVKRWKPEMYSNIPKKEFNHRALDDIKESILELKFYKDNVFNASTKG
ncbi:probable oligoribonuclease [Nasonia vitripennis]|uniref:Probable oligoribonuclease n=1 Tax=Nasonia vitripennis TaxID=7425 RepID=A0A7M7HCF2_NASVI|nr:probable oligoribonuclease [Nasonia vitripennis]